MHARLVGGLRRGEVCVTDQVLDASYSYVAGIQSRCCTVVLLHADRVLLARGPLPGDADDVPEPAARRQCTPGLATAGCALPGRPLRLLGLEPEGALVPEGARLGVLDDGVADPRARRPPPAVPAEHPRRQLRPGEEQHLEAARRALQLALQGGSRSAAPGSRGPRRSSSSSGWATRTTARARPPRRSSSPPSRPARTAASSTSTCPAGSQRQFPVSASTPRTSTELRGPAGGRRRRRVHRRRRALQRRVLRPGGRLLRPGVLPGDAAGELRAARRRLRRRPRRRRAVPRARAPAPQRRDRRRRGVGLRGVRAGPRGHRRPREAAVDAAAARRRPRRAHHERPHRRRVGREREDLRAGDRLVLRGLRQPERRVPRDGTSQCIAINHTNGHCEADPGQTYSADYLGMVPPGGCATRDDCASALGGRASAWSCVVEAGMARGTCTCTGKLGRGQDRADRLRLHVHHDRPVNAQPRTRARSPGRGLVPSGGPVLRTDQALRPCHRGHRSVAPDRRGPALRTDPAAYGAEVHGRDGPERRSDAALHGQRGRSRGRPGLALRPHDPRPRPARAARGNLVRRD